MSVRRIPLTTARPAASRAPVGALWRTALATVVLMAGCGSEEFPGAPGGAGDLNVPYVTTYNFGFQVQFVPIFGTNGNLQIISSADLTNLISAANITRAPGTGVIGGRVLSFAGVSVADVVLAATDVNGRNVGEFFYNSLGGTPDFVQTRGTTTLGGFTAFNAEPGEVFLTAVAGGRGATRVLAFPDEVSLTVVPVTPVVIPVIGIVGEIDDDSGQSITSGGDQIGIEVVGQRLSEAGNCRDETPTQDRVTASQLRLGTAFRYCVASDGDYFARLTGDARFVTTYQRFNSNSARLTALQTAELTEFFTIQTREGLDEAARAAGTAWDPTKGAVASQVQYSQGAPRSGAVVRITDETGRELAATGGGVPNQGALLYLDQFGRPIPGATSTGAVGRFVALNLPIPSGAPATTVYVSITAERPTAGVPERYTATSILPIFPGAVMYQDIATTSLPGPVTGEDSFPPFFTGPVSGRVMDEDGLAQVANARISTLGVRDPNQPNVDAPQMFDALSDGRYEIPINPDPAQTTPLLQSSVYLVRVEGPNGSTAYLPTYQRIRTGRTEVDPVTNQFRQQTQNLIAVASAAVDNYQQTTLDLESPQVLRMTDLGVVLGTAVDISTNRPAAGISVRLTALDGSDASGQPSGQSAKIYYFDLGGIPRRDLRATTADGRFIVFNAPVGTVSLDVTSTDDTGNVLADSRAGGASVVLLAVNNAAPQSVEVSGRFTPLAGSLDPSTVITLTAAGGDPIAIRKECPAGTSEREGLCYEDPDNRQGLESKVNIPCSEQSVYGPYRREQDGYCQLLFESAAGQGTFTVPVGSFQEIGFKTSGPGLMDTYTFGLRTSDLAVNGASVGMVTTGAVDDALPSGLTRSAGTAVIWGQTTAANLGFVDEAGNVSALTCESPEWTDLTNNGSSVGCDKLGSPGVFVTGSFNDDTYRDLAIIDTSTSPGPRVTIWLNTGSGSFALSQEIWRTPLNNPSDPCNVGDAGCGVEEGPVALLVVDYTGDGVSDLVVLNRLSRSISLLEGRGRGRFVFGGSLVVGPSGSEPTAMAAADFNRDRIPDLLIADRITGEIGLLFGTGAGFRPPLPGRRVGNDPRAVLSGQLDFDATPDLVFVNCESIGVMREIGVTNQFTEYRVPGDSTPECDAADFSAAAIGDVDRTGFNDVVVADRAAGDPRIWIFPNGPLGLEAPTSLPAGPHPVAVAVLDVNNDRSPDLVVIHQDGTVMYREGDGTGRFGPQFLFPVSGGPVALVMDDVTGDGAVDAILSDPLGDASSGTPTPRMVILPQTTRPVGGVAVAAVQASGQAVGQIAYLDEQGAAMPGATITGPSGRFAIFNVPPGPIWLRLVNGGLGSRFLHAYADAVTNTAFQVIRGESTTVSIRGVTVDAVLRPVGEVQIRFLGTQRATSSNPIVFDSQGNATGGANYLAIIEANSDYVIQLSK